MAIDVGAGVAGAKTWLRISKASTARLRSFAYGSVVARDAATGVEQVPSAAASAVAIA
jgi:hypothetical protein